MHDPRAFLIDEGPLATAIEAHADRIPAGIRRPLAILSRREREVLRQLLAGHSGPEVAERLAISPRTVEIHRQRIARKFGLATVQAVIHLLYRSVRATP
ncbi:LuxR C-terminal-related transcriptional regulator [Endothiovibrio diazotrophicus]